MSFVFAAQKAETSRLLCKYGCVSNISSRIDWRIFALRLQLPYFISRIGDRHADRYKRPLVENW